MTWWRSRARREDELREEIDSHLKMAALEHIEKGDSPAAAQQRARREFGNRSLIQEATREVWGGIWLEQFARDLKHALRVFVANPGFTITAVAALALGIGANTAVFSVVNAVLFKPLPYRNPDRMVQFGYTFPGGSFNRGSEPAFNVWRQQSDVFEDVSAYMDAIVNLTGVADPEQIRSAQVSVDFFRLFGARIAQGRTFSGDKDHPGGGHLVVLSDGFWKRVSVATRVL